MGKLDDGTREQQRREEHAKTMREIQNKLDRGLADGRVLDYAIAEKKRALRERAEATIDARWQEAIASINESPGLRELQHQWSAVLAGAVPGTHAASRALADLMQSVEYVHGLLEEQPFFPEHDARDVVVEDLRYQHAARFDFSCLTRPTAGRLKDHLQMLELQLSALRITNDEAV
jgi:hypothetical protein